MEARFRKDPREGIIMDLQSNTEWLVAPDQGTSFDDARDWAAILGDGFRLPFLRELEEINRAGIGAEGWDISTKCAGYPHWGPFENGGRYIWSCEEGNLWCGAREDSLVARFTNPFHRLLGLDYINAWDFVIGESIFLKRRDTNRRSFWQSFIIDSPDVSRFRAFAVRSREGDGSSLPGETKRGSVIGLLGAGFEIDSESGVIVDRTAGLEWLKGPDVDMRFDDARHWAETLGYRWLLPSLHQLYGLFSAGIREDAWGPFNTGGEFVWARKGAAFKEMLSILRLGNRASGLDFRNCRIRFRHETVSSKCRVFAVRSRLG